MSLEYWNGNINVLVNVCEYKYIKCYHVNNNNSRSASIVLSNNLKTIEKILGGFQYAFSGDHIIPGTTPKFEKIAELLDYHINLKRSRLVQIWIENGEITNMKM